MYSFRNLIALSDGKGSYLTVANSCQLDPKPVNRARKYTSSVRLLQRQMKAPDSHNLPDPAVSHSVLHCFTIFFLWLVFLGLAALSQC